MAFQDIKKNDSAPPLLYMIQWWRQYDKDVVFRQDASWKLAVQVLWTTVCISCVEMSMDLDNRSEIVFVVKCSTGCGACSDPCVTLPHPSASPTGLINDHQALHWLLSGLRCIGGMSYIDLKRRWKKWIENNPTVRTGLSWGFGQEVDTSGNLTHCLLPY